MSKSKPPDSRLGFTREESLIEDKKSERLLPDHVKFPNSNDPYYPVELENVIYDCYNLKVLYDREKTGFEETKDFQIVIGSIIAGRYQVVEFLGSAAFSKAIQCKDLIKKDMVCFAVNGVINVPLSPSVPSHIVEVPPRTIPVCHDRGANVPVCEFH